MSYPRWRTWPTCCGTTLGIGEVSLARDGAAGVAIAGSGDRRRAADRRGLPRHPDAWPGRGGARARLLSQFANPPRVVFVTALRGARGRTPSRSRPRTTCSSRSGRSGWPRPSGGCASRRSCRRATPWAIATPTPFRSSSAASPGSWSAPRSATSRRRATTPACTPRRGSHLVRISLATLEERWSSAGFVRVHRSHLVAVKHIDELHIDSGRCVVRVGETEIPVSRRHTRETARHAGPPGQEGRSG